ncbi:hypothetical protein GCM10010330_47290 [Streptomyces tendae]|nr:hypothetical protein GCM10010330_47290 [Streptomyces tendae]
MSSHTLANSAAIPGTPGQADLPRIVPQRRPGQWAAVIVVLVLLIGALWIVLPQAMRAIVPPAGNTLIGTLKGTSIVSVIAVQLGIGQYYVEKHRARGTERTR